MRNNESNEDIYNSLPVDLFTHDLDEFETDSFGSELENFTSELEPEDELSTSADINENDIKQAQIRDDVIAKSPEEEMEFVFKNLGRLHLGHSENASQYNSIPSPNFIAPVNEENSSMWIRCVRCSKKNEIDCNFCGKCGLQIHKAVSIVESEAEHDMNPEVVHNIKYHYKRPVFCFGPKGNCFASFSSPSKSVRNVSKFHLTVLREFRVSVYNLEMGKIISSNISSIWTKDELKDPNWVIGDSILKDISVMIASNRFFLLDEKLRSDLREYFATISPKDLGSIKMLATQDSVTYQRGEIDQIFHLLVIGKTMDACELCIKFNYWDHALIIAKTLDVSFYETVMNRFLDSRFTNGHPLRILYLIMTNNENYALEEIRNMIRNQNMPLFVQDIWTILINFLLRAKHESMVIVKIFEDIAKCLFDRELFENSLVCFIISILAGSNIPNTEVLQKIDYLISWFSLNKSVDTINFATIHIVNLFVEKINTLNHKSILWRCQFIRLFYSQFLHDFGKFDVHSLNGLGKVLDQSKSLSDYGFPSLLVEECSIIEARNFAKIEQKQTSLNCEDHSAEFASVIPNNTIEHIFINSSNINSSTEHTTVEYVPSQFVNLEPSSHSSGYPQFANEDIISSIAPLSPSNQSYSNTSGKNMSDSLESPSSGNKSQQTANDKSDSSNVFNKLKNWFPAGKPSVANQENQKQVTKAKMGKPNSFRYDEKLKKWVDDNDPSTFEQAPKLPPPPTIGVSSSPATGLMSPTSGNINFRAKKGKVKYFDPLNPDGPSSTQLQPSVPNFD